MFSCSAQAAELHCGGVAGPGLAYPSAEGWRGLLVDMCRAVAVAVGSDPVFRPYLRDVDFSSSDDVVFLTVGDMIRHDLLGRLSPGPVIYYRVIGLAVDEASPMRNAADLGADGVCFEPGTVADRALESYFVARHLPLHPMPFQEAEEMADAFAGHRCAAVAGEVTALGDGVRVLPDVLAAIPVLAATRVSDGRMGAVVGWVVATLLRAAGGAAPVPIDAPGLGLAPGWQARVVAAVGGYDAMYRRNFGVSVLAGPNALHEDGGLLVAPAAE